MAGVGKCLDILFNAVTILKVDSIMGNFSQCRLCPFNQRARYPVVLYEMINRLYFQAVSFLSKKFLDKKYILIITDGPFICPFP